MIRNTLLAIAIILYFTNSLVLQMIYDVSDYDQFVKFWEIRGIIYDGMFTALFLVGFWSTQGIAKSLCCFGMVMTCGSFIDKSLFSLNRYLVTDIPLTIIAAAVSIYIYRRWKRGEN